MNRQEILQIAKPILFNTEMVRATLDGRKTATRRINKNFIPQEAEWGYTAFTPKGCISCRGYFESGYGEKFYKLPYQVGDILYVRETWSPVWVRPKRYQYKASPEVSENVPISWHPSIHMPKEAARIFLKITDIKAERLQDITPEECLHEGVEHEAMEVGGEFARGMFSDIWDSTIKKQDLGEYGWEANPWVWVYNFERVVAE